MNIGLFCALVQVKLLADVQSPNDAPKKMGKLLSPKGAGAGHRHHLLRKHCH